MKKKFLKLSLITLIVGVVFFALAFFCFHFVTDQGITLTYHKEAEKPFVSELLGDFGVLNLFASFISLLIHFIFIKENDEQK